MPQRSTSWLVLPLYFLAVIVCGAALAPWLFDLGQWYVARAAEHGWNSLPVLGGLADEARKADFQRYFNRAVLVSALALLWPAARLLKPSKGEIPGLRLRPGDTRDALAGFVLAGGMLLAMGWYLLSVGVFKQNPKADVASVLGAALTAAVAVAIIEDWLFRGAFTAIVGRALGPRQTLLVIALMFAVLHFMEPPENLRIPHESVNAATGFQLAGTMLGRLASPATFAEGFLNLLVVGLLLGWARLATGGLWLGIGLHAGWVLALKGFSGMTRRTRDAGEILSPHWIGKDLRTGLLPLGFLLATALLLAVYLHWRKSARGGRGGSLGTE